MPSVRTASAPPIVPNNVASASAIGVASHQGQSRLTLCVPVTPKIAYMYPAIPATVSCIRLTMPP